MIDAASPVAEAKANWPTDEFDLAFYRSHYPDLAKLGDRAVRRHYPECGRREGRYPNAAAFIISLEASEGSAPDDFDPVTYLALNPDLSALFAAPWQARAHFLTSGRKEQRPYGVGRPSRHLTQVARSTIDQLRLSLELALGPEGVDDDLVRHVHAAILAARTSATPGAVLIDPVVVARHRRLHPRGVFDFSDLRVQLRAVFDVAFSTTAQGSRRVEREALHRVRRAAVEASLDDAGDDLPPATLLMLAGEAASRDRLTIPATYAERFDLLARFFVQYVPRLDLERYVTPEQRAWLRAPYRGGPPLAVWLLDHVSRAGAPGADRTAAFWDEEVWRSGLAYVLSSEQLEATQLRIETEGDARRLAGPAFVMPVQAAAEPGWSEREAAEAWLRAYVAEGVQAEQLPQVLVGPSVAAHLWGVDWRPDARPLSASGAGRRRLQVGELVTLAGQGGGEYPVGPGWREPGPEVRWTGACSAVIAFVLDADGDEPLDLFLTLRPAAVGVDMVVTWNGEPVAYGRSRSEADFAMHCHLGRRRRTAGLNTILGFTVASLHGGERRGVGIRNFMLAPR